MNTQPSRSWALAGVLCAAALPTKLESQQSVLTAPRVSAERLEHPAPGEWLQSGRDYSNWRYSPLARITRGNVGRVAPRALLSAADAASERRSRGDADRR